LWHYSDAPHLLQVGSISAGLPTLGIEGRFIGALQT
jgi:hypothetical protein